MVRLFFLFGTGTVTDCFIMLDEFSLEKKKLIESRTLDILINGLMMGFRIFDSTNVYNGSNDFFLITKKLFL